MNSRNYTNLFIKNIERIAPKITNAKLSQITGVSQGTISQIYSGRQMPSLETIIKIAQGIGVEPAVLISENKDSNIPEDILEMLKNRDPIVYETIRNLLKALDHTESKKKKGVS